MPYLLIIFLILFQTPLFAQVHVISDDEVRLRIVNESIHRYRATYNDPCVCPGHRQPDGNICIMTAWHQQIQDRPICYTTEVTPYMILSYRRRHEPGFEHPQGIASHIIRHHPLSNVAATTGIDTAKNGFVFNGVLYHPLTQEGCNRITIGTPLSIVHMTFTNNQRYSSNAVIFRLPDGSRCLASSLGPTNF